MANCHDLFKKFHEKIKLSSSKEDYLRRSRESCREDIRKYFKDKKEEIPDFLGQGSYLMRTMVNPLSEDYDIDDGVNLRNLPKEKVNWPKTETVHEWIKEAVKDKTITDPIDKKNCVRIVYANDYHVDLPIYGKYDGTSYLACLADVQWIQSEPIKLANWFINKVNSKGEQLRIIVRYLKAWANNKTSKMPSGLILSVLASQYFSSDEQDDKSFSETIKNIYDKIRDTFEVKNPVDPTEDLTNRLTDIQKNNFIDALKQLIHSSETALGDEDKEKATKTWREEFGDRFPEYKKSDDEKRTPIVIAQPAGPHCVLDYNDKIK